MRLRVYLILMAVAIVIPVIAFSALALRMLQNAERTTALQGLHETAQGVSLLVDRELYSAEAALQVLAASPYLEKGDLKSFYEQAQTADRAPGGWTILLDDKGHQIINTSVPFETILSPPPATERVQKVLQTNRTLVSDVALGAVSKKLVTTLNIPVALKNGRRYVLAETFTTEHFNQLIASAHAPPEWLVGLIDGQGRFIARSLNRAEMVGKSARMELIEAGSKSQVGLIRHSTLEGTESYDVFTHSPLSGWMLAIAAPVDLIEESAHHAAMVATLGMLAAILAAGAAAILFGRRLEKSISQAADAAFELGHGKFPQPTKSNVIEVNHLHVALQEAGRLLANAQEDRRIAESERQKFLTSEQRARQLAEQQNKAKDEFLAMLGHELRNPLAPISAAAHLLKLPGLDEKRAHYTSDVITRQIDHMSNLLNDLLDVSRVTRGLVTLSKKQVDFKSAVAGAVEQVSPLIESKHHALNIDLPAGPLWVLGDKTRLIQSIANLLINAAKYTKDGGKITLDVAVDGDYIVLNVRDNGAGFNEELLPRIFDLFSQGDRMPDRSEGGLGLGLALVKCIVELHGGSVNAHSEGHGKGSIFTIKFPLLKDATAEIEIDQKSAAAANPALRIMIVDDNVDAADSLAQYLKEANGHSVSVFYDGQSAIDGALHGIQDVYILDIGLPDMDGFELARRLRAMHGGTTAVLIALTGYGQAQDRREAIAAGFDYHFSKPANPKQLSALLAELHQSQSA